MLFGLKTLEKSPQAPLIWEANLPTAAQDEHMAYIRQRGTTWHLALKHRLLPKTFFKNFNTEEEAQTFAEQFKAMLDRGVVPQGLLEDRKSKSSAESSPTVTSAVLSYLGNAPSSPSESELLMAMLDELKGYRLSDITYDWSEKYIRYLKSPRKGVLGASKRKLGNLAPSSIRKRVSALSRVLDWHGRKNTAPRDIPPVNPLKNMPRGYSVYNKNDVAALAGSDCKPKQDISRDRRLTEQEIQTLENWLTTNKWMVAKNNSKVDIAPDLLMFMRLALHTGMRMREIVRLRVQQLNFFNNTISVEGTKGHRGMIKPRQVPMKPHLREQLRAWCHNRVGLVLGLWDGSPETLPKLSSDLSNKFRSLFSRLGIEDFKEHDFRHTACCLWMELRLPNGGWVYSDIEMCRLMGWTDAKMYLRYASLRGEDLSSRLKFLEK